MKCTQYCPTVRIVFLALLAGFSQEAARAGGIPEPGMVFFGTVSNSIGDIVVPLEVRWQIAGRDNAEIVRARIVSINGKNWYVALIPFETRSVAGLPAFSRTPGTFALTQSATTYTRSATVNGVDVSIVLPQTGTFTFSPADCGTIQRVDLVMDSSGDSSKDTDADGAPDWAEFVANTNPNDPKSIFTASTDLQPTPDGGLLIKWSSVVGKTYSIHRTTNLNQGFIALSTGLSATAPQNLYFDSTATNAGPYFYRIQVNPSP